MTVMTGTPDLGSGLVVAKSVGNAVRRHRWPGGCAMSPGSCWLNSIRGSGS